MLNVQAVIDGVWQKLVPFPCNALLTTRIWILAELHLYSVVKYRILFQTGHYLVEAAFVFSVYGKR